MKHPDAQQHSQIESENPASGSLDQFQSYYSLFLSDATVGFIQSVTSVAEWSFIHVFLIILEKSCGIWTLASG